MPDSDHLKRMELARPKLSLEDAIALLKEHYGREGSVSELGSQQDRNFLLATTEGNYVLKVCHASYATVELEAQNAAMRHLGALGAPAVPVPVAALNGDEILPLEIDGEALQIRLLTFLDGEQLTRQKYLGTDIVAAMGSICARTALGLANFEHAGLDRTLQWDLRRAGPVALQLLATISDHGKRDRIAKSMIAAVKRLHPLAPQLRVQAIHDDVTDDNVVALPDGRGGYLPFGVIDFGDIMRGWLVADIAVTCASLLHHADGDPFFVLPAIRAFHDVYPLHQEELKALWPLIVARAGILVASSERQLAIEPDNAYVAGNIDHEWTIFDTATSVPYSLMETAILSAVADEPVEYPPVPTSPLMPDIEPDIIGVADLSVQSLDFNNDNWSDPEIDWKLLAAAAGDTGIATTRYGEYRLSYTKTLSPRAPATYALHIDMCLPAGTRVVAPFAGTVLMRGHHLVLVSPDFCLHIDGLDCPLDAGDAIEQGEPLGVIAGETGAIGGLRLQLCRDPDLVPPLFSRPEHAQAWSVICPSPSPLFGVDVSAPEPETAALLQRRRQAFAASQKYYYADPPQIERGWQEHLFDVTGRAYLDMVNNVTTVGHGHARIARAAGRQWAMLNTNSRFHYGILAEYSERLAALAPEGLDTVFLVNSGSEAVDLALRLAWAKSGKRNILSLLEAYHGWTVASDAVSTSIADNPNALATRPGWVHPVLSPNAYRGMFRGGNALAGYVDAVSAKLDELGTDDLAGFISESVYGNAGGIPLPQGYLKSVYEMVRARGGVCIADEVQVGFGRLGHYFWGFEEQDVVPDIITVAKGMGSGQPLGAVITRRDIADALENEGYFFSSSGGSPVSCAVGMTVLDIMRDEALQQNAREVGDHLKEGLQALGDRHDLVGAVHGMGLYLGLEFVRDRETLEPATEETAAICERLLKLGVIMQPTGDHLNVLKIKPPLCLSRGSADFFVSMLDKVLSEGW
ncbi:aminotransferase [Rhizobium sp. RU36D]|uniref:aminotransferase n=1 Tax=Rhizobium sp. RU36D TaxID=1907415 RepID=UPI0009D7A704|nr:aminotransferase [Rhizobium sp. RU36D]SMD01785.1 4-aminobutyrate aminotransferase [Rhizobium sp. RU36D]